ncbi:barstar family protein [Agrobacterium sp. El2ro-1b]|uniref:barstar family protein n=1 Tax=Agrobacterium sp. El2ro-1b TaxID=2969528 RepID=UPI003AB0B4CD
MRPTVTLKNMREIHIDCSDVSSTEEFWQRYVDTVEPRDSGLFGRNLDAFWDAVEGGGPGYPGEVSLVFMNSAHLSGLKTRNGVAFLDALKTIADETSVGNIKFLY